MSSRWARVLRGLVAAFVSVFVAGFAHVVGGGETPGAIGVALALAFSAVACVALAGKTLSLVRMALAVAFSQLAFHLLFTVGVGVGAGVTPGASSGGVASGPAASAGMPGMAGMSHGNGLLETLTTSSAVQATPLSGLMSAGCDYMWIAHIVAGLITLLALRRGEQAFFGLYEGARMHVQRLVRIPFVEPLTSRTLEHASDRRDPDHPAALVVLIGQLRHRGPPQGQFSFI